MYPLNPNGSPAGITGVQTPNGRVLSLMPHPERVTALESNSWYPPSLKVTWGGIGRDTTEKPTKILCYEIIFAKYVEAKSVLFANLSWYRVVLTVT